MDHTITQCLTFLNIFFSFHYKHFGDFRYGYPPPPAPHDNVDIAWGKADIWWKTLDKESPKIYLQASEKKTTRK